MSAGGAEVVVRALIDEKVRCLFGIPGTHNIELYDAMIDASELMPVLITDEQSAGFMADGVARSSGELAVVNVVPGAGLTHALSGIAEAYLDQVPLLVLACGIRQDTGKAFQLHAVDQCAIVRPVSKRVFQPRTHQELYDAIREACQLAREAPQGPAVVEVPANLYLFKGDYASRAPKSNAVKTPTTDEISKTAKLLNESKSIGLYLGAGARGATEALPKLADALDAIVFTSFTGKGVFPESNARWAWNTMGRAAPPQIQRIEKKLDLLLAIGCRFGEVATGSYGLTPPKLIHVDIDPAALGANFPTELAIQSDASAFITALLSSGLLQGRTPSGELTKALQAAHEEIRGEQSGPSSRPPDAPVRPSRLFSLVQEVFGRDAVHVTDSGNGTFLAIENLRLDQPGCLLSPTDYSCMGYSVPAAIGAKLARPSVPVVAYPGDGAFLMTGMELLTATNYKAGIVVILLRDGELSQIAQFQEASLNRKTCTKVTEYDASAIARAVGAEFFKVNTEAELSSAIEKAKRLTAEGKPVIIDTRVDYSQPTYFSKGVVKTNFLRFPWRDRIRLASRVIGRKIFG